MPVHFVILLECARFSNRVSKTTCALLEENRGISHHIVSMFEEEFDNVQRILFPGISGELTAMACPGERGTYVYVPGRVSGLTGRART